MTTAAAGTAGPEGVQAGQAAPEQNGAAAAAQGSTTGEQGLYQQILSAIPPELHEVVEPHLKEWDGNVTKKFQEAADYRSQWEPYESLGLTDFEPDSLTELLEFGRLAADDGQFNDWLIREAEARGLLEPEDDEGQFDLGGEGAGGFDAESVKSMVQETVKEALGPISERFEQGDAEKRQAEANQAIDSKLGELKEQHGEFDTDRVLKLAAAYAADGMGLEAIDKAFEDYQAIRGEGEKGLFKQKAGQPDTPEQGGRPGTAAKPITEWGDAREAALALARSSQ